MFENKYFSIFVRIFTFKNIPFNRSGVNAHTVSMWAGSIERLFFTEVLTHKQRKIKRRGLTYIQGVTE